MRRAFFLFLAFGGYGIAQGCGGSDATIPDGSDDVTVPGNDGGQDVTQTNDTGTNDATTGGDGGATDGGSTDSGVVDSGGGGVLLRCGDASVNDCAQCQGATQPCVYCNFLDASALTGVCTPLHQNCFNTVPQGFQDCVCVQDAGACPESYQVCSTSGGGRCHTCSDNQTNTSLKCENGGTCNAADGGCL